jgi:hypothetical protein
MAELQFSLSLQDALQIWKQIGWATPRDRRLLEQLADASRLRDYIRQSNEQAPEKPWSIAAGFEPFGKDDKPSSRREIKLPTTLFISARSKHLNLFLIQEDCQIRESDMIITRRQTRNMQIFDAPHVLVAEGFSSIAFADFAVSFKHALRGIAGPSADRELLMFLAAYLRSSLAQYFLFHTSSKWGVTRQQVTVDDLLRLPFLQPDTDRLKQIVDEVARLIDYASQKARESWVDRVALVDSTQKQIEPLIFEYFDILPTEQILIEDTINLTIPSFRPTAQRRTVPTIEPSSSADMKKYTTRLCETLNNWGKRSNAQVIGSIKRSSAMGTGLVILEKLPRGSLSSFNDDEDIFTALNQLRDTTSVKVSTFELMRGVKVFNGNRLYILKPLGRRYWTETIALNDADEIASSILMQPSEEPA